MDKYMKKSDVIAYIRKEAKEAQSAFEELGGESGIIAEAFEGLADEFEDFPAADVEPVRHGSWKGFSHSKWYGFDSLGDAIYRDGVLYYCSECNRRSIIQTKYCPVCGARMKKDGESDG